MMQKKAGRRLSIETLLQSKQLLLNSKDLVIIRKTASKVTAFRDFTTLHGEEEE